MKFYVAVTDDHWFHFLKEIKPEDANFWKPGEKQAFRVLEPGAPLLFKLRSPYNVIAGIGFFSKFTTLPLTMAWEVFGQRNGCETLDELRSMIRGYRSDKTNQNPSIGCIVITNPIFFEENDWIPAPPDWKNSIVQGKSYVTESLVGNQIWSQVEILLDKYLQPERLGEKSQLILEDTEEPKYRNMILSRVRLGQRAFRIIVTDSYKRKCAITGERTLPALEASHIKPYSRSGPHFISNSLLLRSDIHKLFDSGYVTITRQYTIEISKRIRDEFENGKEYYRFHGCQILNLPDRAEDRPHLAYVEWHNENVFNG